MPTVPIFFPIDANVDPRRKIVTEAGAAVSFTAVLTQDGDPVDLADESVVAVSVLVRRDWPVSTTMEQEVAATGEPGEVAVEVPSGWLIRTEDQTERTSYSVRFYTENGAGERTYYPQEPQYVPLRIEVRGPAAKEGFDVALDSMNEAKRAKDEALRAVAEVEARSALMDSVLDTVTDTVSAAQVQMDAAAASVVAHKVVATNAASAAEAAAVVAAAEAARAGGGEVGLLRVQSKAALASYATPSAGLRATVAGLAVTYVYEPSSTAVQDGPSSWTATYPTAVSPNNSVGAYSTLVEGLGVDVIRPSHLSAGQPGRWLAQRPVPGVYDIAEFGAVPTDFDPAYAWGLVGNARATYLASKSVSETLQKAAQFAKQRPGTTLALGRRSLYLGRLAPRNDADADRAAYELGYSLGRRYWYHAETAVLEGVNLGPLFPAYAATQRVAFTGIAVAFEECKDLTIQADGTTFYMGLNTSYGIAFINCDGVRLTGAATLLGCRYEAGGFTDTDGTVIAPKATEHNAGLAFVYRTRRYRVESGWTIRGCLGDQILIGGMLTDSGGTTWRTTNGVVEATCIERYGNGVRPWVYGAWTVGSRSRLAIAVTQGDTITLAGTYVGGVDIEPNQNGQTCSHIKVGGRFLDAWIVPSSDPNPWYVEPLVAQGTASAVEHYNFASLTCPQDNPTMTGNVVTAQFMGTGTVAMNNRAIADVIGVRFGREGLIRLGDFGRHVEPPVPIEGVIVRDCHAPAVLAVIPGSVPAAPTNTAEGFIEFVGPYQNVTVENCTTNDPVKPAVAHRVADMNTYPPTGVPSLLTARTSDNGGNVIRNVRNVRPTVADAALPSRSVTTQVSGSATSATQAGAGAYEQPVSIVRALALAPAPATVVPVANVVDWSTVRASVLVVQAASGTSQQVSNITNVPDGMLIVIRPYTGHSVTIAPNVNFVLRSSQSVGLSGNEELTVFRRGGQFIEHSRVRVASAAIAAPTDAATTQSALTSLLVAVRRAGIIDP